MKIKPESEMSSHITLTSVIGGLFYASVKLVVRAPPIPLLKYWQKKTTVKVVS